jgi:hypothetical protein
VSSERYDPKVLVEFDTGTTRQTARRLGIDPSLLCRPLSLGQVDKYCLRLGFHPMEVYGFTGYFCPEGWDEDAETDG